jgi:hypothetical protein
MCAHSPCASFKADAIACRPGTTNTTACLNADQINALNNIYRDYVLGNDTLWVGRAGESYPSMGLRS